jgi:hypothetical protein
MSNLAALREALLTVAAAALVAGVALPALAGDIYSWRTEDGSYAFTDDEKAIPARYRPHATARTSTGLAGYERLTTPPRGAGDAYSQRLSQRLAYLRSLNRELDAAQAKPAPKSGLTSLAIATGGLNLGVPVDDSDGPVFVEKVRFRHHDEMATRHNLVVKQGGRVLTVIKGAPLVGPIDQASRVGEAALD